MFNLKIQGTVVVSGDESKCLHCLVDAELVNIHDWLGEDVWEGCANCLIDELKHFENERKNFRKKIKEALNRKEVDCLCKNIGLGCKCGAIAREKFLKKTLA